MNTRNRFLTFIIITIIGFTFVSCDDDDWRGDWIRVMLDVWTPDNAATSSSGIFEATWAFYDEDIDGYDPRYDVYREFSPYQSSLYISSRFFRQNDRMRL